MNSLIIKYIVPYLVEKQKTGEKTISLQKTERVSLEMLELMLKNKKRNLENAENYKNSKNNII